MDEKKILVIDDEPEQGWIFSKVLSEEGYQVLTATDGPAGLKKIENESPDLVILDIKMPGMDGLETLRRIKEINVELLVIMLTAYETVQTAVKSMKMGAYDYLSKPIDNEKLKIIIKNALKTLDLTQEVFRLKEELKERFKFASLDGESAAMQKLYALLEKAISTDVSVLLRGESGTGKELAARIIHYNSLRKDKPFITVDCATLPETLVESEIFGYEKGAFTGAISRKLGKCELANEGTLFLDEVGNLSLDTQKKLLRMLQEREIVRLGSNKPIKIDVRIVTATNTNLEELIKKRVFREDLYYRLKEFSIVLPPLREREEDVLLLARLFLNEFNKEFNKKVKEISPEAMALLMRYSWPGNVRELKNVMRSSVLLAKKYILPENFPQEIQLDEVFSERVLSSKVVPDEESQEKKDVIQESLKEIGKTAKKEVEKQAILRVLKEVNGNKSKAARLLKIDYKTLYNKIKKYNIHAQLKD